MRRFKLVVAMLFLSVGAASAASSDARAASVYMSADAYMMVPHAERLAFIQGVFETLADLHRDGHLSEPRMASDFEMVERCTRESRLAWIEATFVRWLDAHVERWNEAMSYLLLDALKETCGRAGTQNAAASGG